MTKLIENLLNKNLEGANKVFQEHIQNIVEKKLEEVKKMLAAEDSTSKVPPWGQVNPQAGRKPLKGKTKIVKEAIVQPDGLVHLSTGEKILPSVYRARRGLTEEQLDEVDYDTIEKVRKTREADLADKESDLAKSKKPEVQKYLTNRIAVLKTKIDTLRGASIRAAGKKADAAAAAKPVKEEADKPDVSLTNDAYGAIKGTEAINAAKKAVLKAMLMKGNKETIETDDEAKTTSCQRELEKK